MPTKQTSGNSLTSAITERFIIPGEVEKPQVLTKDIFQVAYYLANGMTIRNIMLDVDCPRERATFIVEGPGIDRFERAVKTGTATVHLLVLKACMKRAKDLMFDFLRSQNCYQSQKGARENESGRTERNT